MGAKLFWFTKQSIGCLTAIATLGVAAYVTLPLAQATPGSSAAEQDFFSEVYLYAHPPVTDQRLLQLGYQACSIRRNGGSTDNAKEALWNSLYNGGVVSSNAEIGSLVHVAIDTLCPEVGYP